MLNHSYICRLLSDFTSDLEIKEGSMSKFERYSFKECKLLYSLEYIKPGIIVELKGYL